MKSSIRTCWICLTCCALAFTETKQMDAQMIVAHRGASFDAPENTLAAFKLAWEENADAIEGDFHLTSDGKVVCIHDKDTLETAGINHLVAETTFEELGKLDVGSWFSPKFKNERIPTLQQVLELVPENKSIFIEIKSGVETVPAVAEIIAASDLEHKQIVIISFHADVIRECKKRLPNITANWLTGFEENEETGEWTPDVQTILRSVKECGADGVGVKGNRAVVNKNFVDAIQRQNRGVHCWTIDDPDDAKYFRSIGMGSITTNRPHFIRFHLDGKNGSSFKN